MTLIALAEQKKLTEASIRALPFSGEVAWLAPNEACDIFLETPPPPFALEGIDCILQPAATRRKKLLISDMDSTMIEQECIDELAAQMGLKEQVSTITERAMNGELDFKQALRERVALLTGLPVSALENVYRERITFMPGAKELVATMRANGAYCLLVSGGFTYFTGQVSAALGFHEHHANELEIKDGMLTGKVIEPILDKESKLASLKNAVEKLGITAQDVLALGDGANDLPMLQAAGLGIAYHAKPTVRAAAKACINHANLRAALFAQGYSASEFLTN